MPKYTGQQLSTINSLASQIPDTLNQLHDFGFGFNDEAICVRGLFGNEISAAPEQRCFKPANQGLRRDSLYWRSEFLALQNIASEALSAGEISISEANRFVNITTKFIEWCTMVTVNYFGEDIPAYHNKVKVFATYIDAYLIIGLKVPLYETKIIEPTTTLSSFSEPCEYFDSGELIRVKGYFNPQEYQALLDDAKQKAETINNLLNSPTPDPETTIQPIQVDSTGTNKLLKTLGEIFSYVKDSFNSLNQDIGKIQTTADVVNKSIHDLRSVELKQARQILQDLRGEDNEPTVSTQLLKYNMDRQEALFLIGSEGNYYPVDLNYFPGQTDSNGLPVDPQTGESLNIVRLSTENGLIYSLRRADDNNQIRYNRVNDTLYEVNTALSQIKPTVEILQNKLDTHDTKLAEILSEIQAMKIVVDSINTRI